MYQFTYWLEHFKELPQSKAQKIVASIVRLSEKTRAACPSVTKLSECNTLSSYLRTKQSIMRNYASNLTGAEKKALSLFGDFLEFKEYSNFKFPEEPKPLLAEYCKTMRMAYSYKAVLILELMSCNPTGTTTEELINKIIRFYRDRMAKGLVVEKDDSVFAKPNLSYPHARKVIMINSMQVLENAKIIIRDEKTDVISFSSEYLPASDSAKNEVVSICKERLDRYYSSISPIKSSAAKKRSQCSPKLKQLLAKLEIEILNSSDSDAKKRMMKIYTSICEEIGIISKEQPDKSAQKNSITSSQVNEFIKLEFDDKRKVGSLVRESMSDLERIDFNFTHKQIENLLSLEWSNTTLKLNYSFLKSYDESKSLTEQRVDHLGNGRYYSRVYTFSGKKYLVTSEWYEKSKPLFITWYNSLMPPKKKT